MFQLAKFCLVSFLLTSAQLTTAKSAPNSTADDFCNSVKSVAEVTVKLIVAGYGSNQIRQLLDPKLNELLNSAGGLTAAQIAQLTKVYGTVIDEVINVSAKVENKTPDNIKKATDGVTGFMCMMGNLATQNKPAAQ